MTTVRTLNAFSREVVEGPRTEVHISTGGLTRVDWDPELPQTLVFSGDAGIVKVQLSLDQVVALQRMMVDTLEIDARRYTAIRAGGRGHVGR